VSFLEASRNINFFVPLAKFEFYSPSGTFSGCELRLKGELLYTAFMDESFCLVAATGESFRDAAAKELAAATAAAAAVNCADQPAACETPPPVPLANCEKKLATFSNRVLTKSSLSPSYTSAVENGNASEEIAQVGSLGNFDIGVSPRF
jgi:hypothetical protein